jgi:hypothetical protein
VEQAIRRSLPGSAADGGKEPLFLDVLFAHIERLAQQLDSRATQRVALEELQNQGGVAKGDRAERQRDRCPDRIARRRPG